MTDDQNAHSLNALRYLSGDMNPEEMHAFEQLLSQGGSVCDALADMVILEQTTRATRGVVQVGGAGRNDSGTGFNGRLWMIGVCAAALVAAVTLMLHPPATWRGMPGSAPAMSPAELSALANTWSDLRNSPPVEADRGDDEEMFAESPQMDVPDWMLTAVGAGDQQPAEGMIDVDQEEQL